MLKYSMPKDDAVYLGHMLDMARKALSLIADKHREDYDRDEVLRLALTYLVQTIGEAASRISAEFCNQHPQIPWKAIIGMRHRIVHDYMNVDEDILWSTVNQELALLIAELEKSG